MNVLIADDHAIVREGIKTLLRDMPAVTQIDEARHGQETLAMIKKTFYDLVILDIVMPDISGLDILIHMRHLDIERKVLVFSFHQQEQYAVRAFKLGASGYISKSSTCDELKDAITKMLNGGRYIPPGLAEKILFNEHDETGQLPHEKLSEREFQVLIMLANGKSVNDIGNIIAISGKTVSTYKARIMKKMKLKTNADCTLYAIRNKLII